MKTLTASAHVLTCAIALSISIGMISAGTITGSVRDYNAAQVRLANGVLTVPANTATYTATATLAIGSTFVVTLPSGFTFATAPSLTTSGTATFTLSSGGVGFGSATFTIATAAVTSGQTISLAAFTVAGATALETVTPVANALPLTMQAIGSDPSPLVFKAFASDYGSTIPFVGAIQFIDPNPPSNGTEFFGVPDSLTGVVSAIAIDTETTDTATSSVQILSPNGGPNTLSPTDTVSVTVNANTGGLARVFSSTVSSCTSTLSTGTYTAGNFTIPNVPINQEIFFCFTGSGQPLGTDPNGFTLITVAPAADFLAAPVDNLFPGVICYGPGGTGGPFGGCLTSFTPPGAVSTPALSTWALIGLAATIALFGALKLRMRSS